MPILKIRPQLFGTSGDPISYNLSEAESIPGVEVIAGDEAFQEYLAKIKRINQDRRANFIYHAFGNTRGEWTIDALNMIYAYARDRELKLAVWENPESAIQLVVIRETDATEDSGWEIYQALDSPVRLFQSYGLAHYTEWDHYGFVLDIAQDPESTRQRGCFKLMGEDGIDIYMT